MATTPRSARTARPSSRITALIAYVRERASLTIPPVEIAGASDLELLTLYDVQSEYRPVTRTRERARKENLRRIYDELTIRGVQW